MHYWKKKQIVFFGIAYLRINLIWFYKITDRCYIYYDILFCYSKIIQIKWYTKDAISEKSKKKNCNVRIDGRRFFDKYVENNTKTCEKTATVATGQGDDCTVDFLIYYPFFFKKPQINTYRSR